jgi:DUF917 family protein
VREHGAPGAISQAIEVGRALIAARGGAGARGAQAVAEHLNGRILDTGRVESTRLEVSAGYDLGQVTVVGRRARHVLTFWNEYMTLESDGQRVATFPDLITTLNAADAVPVASAEIRSGMEIAILTVPGARLILGAGMRDPALFEDIERVLGKEVVRYVF